MIYKLFWAVRAFLYRFMFGSFGAFGYMGAPKFLYGIRKIFIGSKVRIFPGARIEIHGTGRLFIGHNCSIGNDIHIAVAGDLEISEGVLISSSVLVTDIDHEYCDISVPVFDQPISIKKTSIGRNSFIGAGAKILAGSIIGEGCVIGANSVVKGVYPARSVIAGIPARIVRHFDQDLAIWRRKEGV